MTYKHVPGRENIDADLTRHFKSLQLKKKRNRLRYIRNFLIAWSIVVVLALITYALSYYQQTTAYGWFEISAIFAGIIVGFMSTDMLPDIRNSLGVLDSAFMKMYQALEALDLSKSDASYNRKDIEVEQEAYSLIESVADDLDSDDGRQALTEEARVLAKQVVEDVKTRILPETEDGKLKPETIAHLARLLSFPTIEGLRAFSGEVKTMYPNPRKHETVTIRQGFGLLLASRKGQVPISFVTGYGLTIIVLSLVALTTQQDISTIVRNNVGVILVAGGAVSVGLLNYMKK